MKLWLVRHAQPLIASGICYGASDIPADAAATLDAAQALAAQLPPAAGACRIILSPLQRCTALAQQLHRLRPDCPLLPPDARLAEMNFGQWEGVAWSDIPQPALQAWTDDFGNYRFGGVESTNLVLARVAAALAEHRCSATEGQDIIWITHAGVIRAVSLLLQGITQVTEASQWPVEAPGFGQWWVLDLPA